MESGAKKLKQEIEYLKKELEHSKQEKKTLVEEVTALLGKVGETVKIRKEAEEARVAAAKAMAEAEKRRAVELERAQQASLNIMEDLEIGRRELEKANKKLDELSRSKSIFISNISHELRTPLATAKEAIAQVLEGIKGEINPGQKEFLALAYNNANRLSLLINDLLELSKIEAGKVFLAKRFSSPLSPAKKAIEGFTSQASKKGLILLNKLPDTLPELYIDPERIEGVFTNLIDNAIKFTEEGSISIEAEDKETEVCFRVVDTGPGIPATDLDRIFDRYQRLKFTQLPEKSGIGLGLPIVKELIQLHKGRVWAESHLGEGTKIIFTLPKYSDAGYFSELIKETIEWAKAEKGEFSLIVIEIERLQANKLDESLRQMEKELKKFIRLPLDKILRFRNGKSLAIIAKCDRQGAQLIRERIAQAFEKMLNFKIASFPEDGLTEEELLKNLKKFD